MTMPGFERVTADMNLGDELVRLKATEGSAKLRLAQDKAAKSPDGPGRDAEIGRASCRERVLQVV